jgi:hypothetical protein
MLFTEQNFVTLCDSSRNRRAALSEATIPRNLYSRCVATAALRWSKDSVEAPGGRRSWVTLSTLVNDLLLDPPWKTLIQLIELITRHLSLAKKFQGLRLSRQAQGRHLNTINKEHTNTSNTVIKRTMSENKFTLKKCLICLLQTQIQSNNFENR